jgi:hypothetical protein
LKVESCELRVEKDPEIKSLLTSVHFKGSNREVKSQI